jgi:hypothetical protein
MSGFDFEARNDWASWLARIRPELADQPESVEGPHGDAVAVSYHSDPVHGPYVLFRAFEAHVNDERTLVPATVQIAPGAEVELRDVRLYL